MAHSGVDFKYANIQFPLKSSGVFEGGAGGGTCLLRRQRIIFIVFIEYFEHQTMPLPDDDSARITDSAGVEQGRGAEGVA